MKQKITIIADDRERNSHITDYLEKMEGVQVYTRRLSVGDYRADGRLLFERKTLRDFSVSIIDGRLFRQMIQLCHAKQKGILILEGTGKGLNASGIKREAMQGALVTVSLILGIPVLRSKDAAESARLMVYAARQIRTLTGKGIQRAGYRPKTKRMRQLFILQGFPGVGRVRAEQLLAHFGSVEAVIGADQNTLASVGGIGKHTASRIRWAVKEQVDTYGDAGPE